MTAPTIGRIVHYRSYGTPGGEFTGECRAAVVAAVEPLGRVQLCVLNPTGIFFNTCDHVEPRRPTEVTEDAPEFTGGTWHWPCQRG